MCVRERVSGAVSLRKSKTRACTVTTAVETRAQLHLHHHPIYRTGGAREDTGLVVLDGGLGRTNQITGLERERTEKVR